MPSERKNNKSGPRKGKSDQRSDKSRPQSRSRGSARPKTKPSPKSDTIRLNKFIANAGICSRREADTFIAAGSVMVNGKVITVMGFQVKPSDEVKFDGKRLIREKKEYVLLNKPKNFITTTKDEKGRRTVMDLVGNASKSRLYPVGRLDRNTTGLLLFTNDGDMAKTLTHPKHGVRKVYHVHLDKNLRKEDLIKIQKGLELEDGPIEVDQVSYIPDSPKREVGCRNTQRPEPNCPAYF